MVQINLGSNQDKYSRFKNPSKTLHLYQRLNSNFDKFKIEVIYCALPDATIIIDNNIYACKERNLIIEYTVFNYNATAALPKATPISFYVEGALLGQSQSQNEILINESETQFIEFMLPEDTPNNFEILIRVDDIGIGEGIVDELEEEAPTVANFIPYDYRMEQIMQEGRTGIAPEFPDGSATTPFLHKTARFQTWMQEYDHNGSEGGPIKEATKIGNYAATNMLPIHFGEKEVVIHGATMYEPWNSKEMGVRAMLAM